MKALLALALLFGLVACGDDDGDDEAAGATNGASGNGSGGDAACDDSDPVRAGQMFSMSGPAAEIGQQATDGSEMAVEDINAAGGILGRCLEVVAKDDAGDPTKASQVARELVDQEEVDFLVGPFLSSPTGSALEITEPAGLLHVPTSALASAGDAEQYPYVFRVEVATTRQATDFIQYLEREGLSKVGLIAVNNALGLQAVEDLEAGVEGTDIEIVATEFHETGAVDQSAQMNKLKEAGPDVIIMLNTAPPDSVATITARNALEWDVPILGFSSSSYAGVSEGVGAEGMHDVLSGQAWHRLNREPGGDGPTYERAVEFRDRYKEYLGVDTLDQPLQQQASSYDAYWMMATAINEVGDIDPDAVKEHLEENGYDGVRADYTYTPESHEGVGSDDLAFVVPNSFEDGTHEIAARGE